MLGPWNDHFWDMSQVSPPSVSGVTSEAGLSGTLAGRLTLERMARGLFAFHTLALLWGGTTGGDGKGCEKSKSRQRFLTPQGRQVCSRSEGLRRADFWFHRRPWYSNSHCYWGKAQERLLCKIQGPEKLMEGSKTLQESLGDPGVSWN